MLRGQPVPLNFDDVTHTYTLDGRKVPSVTQAMADVGIIDTEWYKPEHALRGKHVHEAAQYFDEDDLDPTSILPHIVPYLDAWIQFRKDTGFKPHLIEQRVWRSCGYAGTLDRTGWLNDRYILLDLKSGGLPNWTGLQTSGYEHALVERILAKEIEAPIPQARFAVQVKKDGKYNLKEYTDWQDKDNFLAALRVYQWKHPS
jgi:hypothetical protein